MIWIDSSFAIEWYLGTAKAKVVKVPKGRLAILPAQYSEILIYFSRKTANISAVVGELEALQLETLSKVELLIASQFFLKSRLQNSKASLADCLLAAAVINRNETLLSFDQDFKTLGLIEHKGVWKVPS